MVGTGPAPAPPSVAGSPSDAGGSSTGGAAEPVESPILLAIRREGEAQAAAILAEAAGRGEELVALAEAAADERVRRAVVDVGPAIAREANRIVNEARVRAIHRRTRTAADRLDAVFAAAARRLAERASNPADPRWQEALARLADDATRFTGEGSSLVIGESGGCSTDPSASPVAGGSPDPAPARPVGGGTPGPATAGSDSGASPDPAGGSPDPADLDCDEEVRPGVVCRSSDGRLEVDATIETRLAQARLRMADVVGRILLGDEGP
jgi:vacuolar-type H+-ATPase subunit E/Vma4